MIRVVVVIVFLILAGGGSAHAQKKAGKFNVLFIAVDDLNTSLGCYGHPLVQSPNIDRLAARGLLFRRAYCQQALCSPSRTSLLTGRRPDTTRVYDLTTHFRRALPDVVTLPQYFKNQGYHTQALGKIYHGAFTTRAGEGGPNNDDKPSWSIPWWSPQPHYYHTPRGMEIARQWYAQKYKKSGKAVEGWKDEVIRGLPWEAPDVPDSQVSDGQIADRAIQVLRQVKDKPFFLALGFLKPHLPFVAPKRYFDLYPPEKIELAKDPYLPKGAPPFASLDSDELRVYHGMPHKGPVPDEQSRELIRAYYACISFVDAQVGRVLDELDRLQLRDKTIVVFWGDHGFHLGENGIWCKQTNWEKSLHAPLLLAVPGQPSAGKKTDALVEFVDIYPSVVDMCGLSPPSELEGTSFKPLFTDPSRPWKKAVFSQHPRPGGIMGRTMRTERYRYVEWRKGTELVDVELYDLQTDPDGDVNLAPRQESKQRLKELSKQLRAGWRAAVPEQWSRE